MGKQTNPTKTVNVSRLGEANANPKAPEVPEVEPKAEEAIKKAEAPKTVINKGKAKDARPDGRAPAKPKSEELKPNGTTITRY